MARRPTQPQVQTLERIRQGYPPNATETERRGLRPLSLASFDSSVQGEMVICHRVVRDGSQLGRTELFRIYPDGFASQH